jgi:hypothetical protein
MRPLLPSDFKKNWKTFRAKIPEEFRSAVFEFLHTDIRTDTWQSDWAIFATSKPKMSGTFFTGVLPSLSN